MQYNNAVGFGVEFDRPNVSVFCPFCEDNATSKTPSCSVSEDGVFNCKSCGETGTVVKFYARKTGVSERQARATLSLPGKPQTQQVKRQRRTCTIPPSTVEETTMKLAGSLSELNYLTGTGTRQRGLHTDTLARYEIGCDEYRITIPVRDEDGELLTIRRYSHTSKPKMVCHMCGDPTPVIYPSQCLEEVQTGDDITLCEGEWDCLLLRQNGFHAFTISAGVNAWSNAHLDIVAKLAQDTGSNVNVIFDVNDKKQTGLICALSVASELLKRDINVRIVRLPLTQIGGDITDWFVEEHHNCADLQSIINGSKLLTYSDVAIVQQERMDLIATFEIPTLDDDGTEEDDQSPIALRVAGDASNCGRVVNVRAIVAGKKLTPYLIPRKIRISVSSGDLVTTSEHVIGPHDEVILRMVNCSSKEQTNALCNRFGAPTDASRIDVLETMNIEELFLAPDPDSPDSETYTIRQVYYIGHGLNSNRTYTMRGITLPHPKTQSVTHIMSMADPMSADIDAFTLASEEIAQMKAAFSSNDVHSKMLNIADCHSRQVTRIVERSDLHIAVDLSFHSALRFKLDDQVVPKGWVELLVLGDTRTGKGMVTERLAKYYRVGELVSGECVSVAGLVGGLQKLEDRWTLVWGRIPLNDRRLVIIDEAGGLSTSDISKLSRIRSEGRAEITKIITEQTTARTRLIWLANPRSERSHFRMIKDFNYGIESVAGLIGAAEDVARFDMALIVAQDEVSCNKINAPIPVSEASPYTSDLCHKLVMWSWSRNEDQIHISPEATQAIFKFSRLLSGRLISSICLVQAEDVRFKIARIAVASAMRTFSTEDGHNVIVRGEHVDFAYNFLLQIYSKAASGYAQLSEQTKARSTLRDPKAIIRCLGIAQKNLRDLVDGLMEHQEIAASDICDYTTLSREQAADLLAGLVRERAVFRAGNIYIKKPPFRALLEALQSKLNPVHLTEGESNDQIPSNG